MSIITDVEDALLARVVGAFAPGQLRTVKSLPGALNGDLLKQLAPEAPGVYASFLGAAPARNLTDRHVDARWALYVLTWHASGEAARRRGDSVAIGAYEILPPLVAAVVGAPIDNAGLPRLVRIENLWSGQHERRGLALYAATFEVPVEMTGTAPTLDAFETFHADYDVPPFVSGAQHQAWLQEPPNHSSSVPDASDDVELSQ